MVIAPHFLNLGEAQPFPDSIPLANELPDLRVRFRQRLLVGKENDAEMLRARLLPESGSVHNHNVLLADQFLHKGFIALGNVNPGKGVECSAWCHATDSRRRLAPFLGEVSARTKLALHFGEMILRDR